jgi:2-polyprenyl-3-methyl-5-hydroxy-6-metoxy-1,4-benzoquinol methylase
MFASLARRERIPELMDDPALDPAAHRLALAGLARANRFSRSADILWPSVLALARNNPAKPLRILDVATGSGDVPLALAERAKRAGVRLDLHGCDVSDTAVSAAREAAARAGVTATFFRHDAVADPLPAGFDVATCSLFLHHLSEDDAVTVLRRMGEAARVVLVNDMERSVPGFLLAWVAARVLSRSPVVHFDGPASARSAFTPAEALRLAESAGLHGATVRWRFPCRYLVKWSRR